MHRGIFPTMLKDPLQHSFAGAAKASIMYHSTCRKHRGLGQWHTSAYLKLLCSFQTTRCACSPVLVGVEVLASINIRTIKHLGGASWDCAFYSRGASRS